MREAALRPFQVLEALELPAQYERSFKIAPGRLIAQRFMLGVRTGDASPDRLLEAARRLGMPADVQPVFEQALAGASSVLFGFEGSEATPPDPSHHPSPHPSAVLKVYTEYRSRWVEPPAHSAPVELFRGFKWQVESPTQPVQTVYWGRPGWSVDRIREQIGERLAASTLTPVRELVGSVIDRAMAARPGFTPHWIELGEPGEPLRAFDLNLYGAGLRVAALAQPLAALATAFGVDRALLARLLSVAGRGLLGHVSAGFARTGDGFLTVYFEPPDDTSQAASG